MSGVGWNAPPEGFSEVRRRADGTIIGRAPSKEDEAKRLVQRKAAMQRYEQRSKEQEQKAIRKAAGVKEPVEIHAPKDVLDLTVMNLLAEPALLDAHGSGEGVRTLTQQQRRDRQREQMDARAAENRKALNSFIDPEPEDKFGYDFVGLSGEEAESVIENDPAEDEWEEIDFETIEGESE